MRRHLTIGSAIVLLFLLEGCGSKGVPAPSVHAEADRKNPTEFNARSTQQGKTVYLSGDCVLCHGAEGDGKTFYASDAHMNVHDWRDAGYAKGFTDGQLFDIMANGKGRMPAYSKINTPDQIWLLVDYIRSLSTK